MRLGPYEIVAPLGAGGMGEVYRARDTRLEREVALKIVAGRHGDDPEALRRFAREARIAAQLTHPNVCTLYDAGCEGDVAYFVMELLEGETLAARIDRGPLPEPEVRRIAAGIARGLARAHELGFVHRDLKPLNVFLTSEGPKILDFGLARTGPRGRRRALAGRHRVGPHGSGIDPRHRRLHVARAGARRAGRTRGGRLGLRLRALRDARGAPRLRRPQRDRDARRRPHGRARLERARGGHAGGPAGSRCALPRQGPRAKAPGRRGGRARARERPGPAPGPGDAPAPRRTFPPGPAPRIPSPPRRGRGWRAARRRRGGRRPLRHATGLRPDRVPRRPPVLEHRERRRGRRPLRLAVRLGDFTHLGGAEPAGHGLERRRAVRRAPGSIRSRPRASSTCGRS